MIRVTCPTCGKTLSAPNEKAGQTGKCACGERIRIPSQITTKPYPPMPPAVSTAPEKARSVTKRNSKRVWFIVPLVGIAGIALGVVAVLLLMKRNQEGDQHVKAGNQTLPPAAQPSPTHQPAPVDPDQEEILACVKGWLEDQKRGENGAFYWDNFDRMTSLFAVRSWEILLDKGPHAITVFDSPTDGKTAALIKIRIDSSTQDGMPVSKIWTLSMRKSSNDWKINHIFGQNPGDD